MVISQVKATIKQIELNEEGNMNDETHDKIQLALGQIKQLTLQQYDDSKARVIARIVKLNGDKPTRDTLRQEQDQLITPLDWLMLVVFIAAFAVSSLHIITHTGQLAIDTYKEQAIGMMVFIDVHTFTVVTQLGMILLAEASMLLFMTTWRIETKTRPTWIKFGGISVPFGRVSVSLVLAVVAMAFVFIANAASGLTPLEALMPPVFTVGLGFQLEKLFDNWLERRAMIRQEFARRISIWEAANEDPKSHPEYRPLLMRELWEALSRIKQNSDFGDASTRIKRAAVLREMERDAWVHEVAVVEARAEAAGVDVKADLPDDELEQLLQLVREAPPKSASTIKLSQFVVDLKALTWTEVASGRVRGPYRSRGTMQAAISTALKMRSKAKNS